MSVPAPEPELPDEPLPHRTHRRPLRSYAQRRAAATSPLPDPEKEEERQDDETMALLRAALTSAEDAPRPPEGIVVERLGRWWWRASLGSWEAYGVTAWQADLVLRLMHGLA